MLPVFGQPPQPLHRGTHAVDDRLLRRITKDPGARITRLRARGHCADFDEAEAESGERGGGAGILVIAGGEADGIGKMQAPKVLRQTRVVGGVAPGHTGEATWHVSQCFQRRDTQGVGALRVQRKKQRAQQAVAHAQFLGVRKSSLRRASGLPASPCQS